MAAPPHSAGMTNAGPRRLAAVWFADIVGFSGLASRDENAALQQIHDFQTISRAAVVQHGGRIVKFLGDGAFAEFPSTEGAVRAALAVRSRFAGDAGASGSADRPPLRIGVHVGDVIARPDGDLYGDGVNTASRLQAVARPGQILISGDVWRQLRSLSDLEFRPIGTRALRGIDHPIQIYAVAGEVGAEGDGPGVRRTSWLTVSLVAVIYSVIAWLVIQVAGSVIPALEVPGWPRTVAVIIATLGLPVVVALAAGLEVTSEGIGRGGRQGRGAPSPRGLGARREAAPPPPAPSPLPEPVTTFIGREADTRKIGAMVTGSAGRLVTLTGPGGIGKTSLALHVARAYADRFPDGTVFVPLANQSSGAGVLPLVAERLGLTLAPGVDARIQMTDFLRDKSMLIVLDNFEQLVDHANVLAEMLESAPKVRALVTSRERLDLKAETVYPLDGLAVDGGGGGAAEEPDAVRLFIECPRRWNPHFRAVGADREAVLELCRHLQGIPLAIELAAAWTRAMGCREILTEVKGNVDFLASEMKDVPERHRSVGAVFESAWQRLTDDERTALKRLSVFHGPFDSGAASRVAGVEVQTLSSLLDQSLLRRRDETSFEMLEILRQYAAERLAADEIQLQWITERHASYFLEKQLAPGPPAAPGAGAGDTFANIRAAWGWATAQPRFDLLDGALDRLTDFLSSSARIQEGQELLMATVAAIEPAAEKDATARRLLGRLQIRRGRLCASLGRYEEGRELTLHGLDLVKDFDLTGENARGLENLGRLAEFQGDHEGAREHYQAARDLYQIAGDDHGRGRALLGLGNVAYHSGAYPEADALYQESLRLLENAGYAPGLAGALCNLGVLAHTRGERQRADQFLSRSLEIATQSHDQDGIVTALHNKGVVAFLAGDVAEAEADLRRGLDLAREMGFRRHLSPMLNILGKVLQAQDRPADALAHFRDALSSAQRINDVPAMLEAMVSSASHLTRQAPEAATAAAAFVRAHPATEHQCREAAGAILNELTGSPDPSPPPPQQSLDEAVSQLFSALDDLDVAAVSTPPMEEVP